MASRPNLFWSQTVLLIAVTTALGMAERVWVYWGLAVVGVLISGWSSMRRRRPVLSLPASQAAILAAFLFMLCDWMWISTIGVMALSHFIVLVCIVKLLVRQDGRDQGMVFVLLLILLMVASLVSGHFLFAFVLLTYLVVGLHALVRLHLLIEGRRVQRQNIPILGRVSGRSLRSEQPGLIAVARVSGAAGVVAVTVGFVVFILFPRIEPGMFRQLEGRVVAAAGASAGVSIDFRRVGPIHASRQKVFRVQLQTVDGRTLGPGQVEPYFRRVVFDQYYRRSGPRGGFWEWRRLSRDAGTPQHVVLTSNEELDETIPVLPAAYGGSGAELVVQRYWFEPALHRFLLALYVPREVRVRDLKQVHKSLDDLTLRVYLPVKQPLRYEVVSVVRISPNLAAAMASEYVSGEHPQVALPDPPLPREAEIRALVDRLDNQAGTVGPLDNPEKCERFVRAAMDYLQPPRFRYTHTPSSVRGPREPIADFLLDEREGHCQYFASSLALLCQYRGIPARLVTGYLGHDYNEVGGFYNVTQEDAHAWVEVFLQNRDWVRFDPTPADARSSHNRHSWLLAAYRYLDYLQFQWSNLVVDYDSNARHALFTRWVDWLRRPVGNRSTIRGAVGAFLGELIWWRSELGWHDRVLYWIFTIMVVMLTVLVTYVVSVVAYRMAARLWRWCVRRMPSRLSTESSLYERFRRQMADLGCWPAPGQTPAEFAAQLAGRYPMLQPAPALVAGYYASRYGGHELPVAQRQRMESFLQQLSNTNRVQLDKTCDDGHPS